MEISSSYEDNWYICQKRIPKQEIVFFCQIIVIFVVIITCIVNLSIKNGDSNLWVALLSIVFTLSVCLSICLCAHVSGQYFGILFLSY